jgi:hypothetical protein
MAISDADLAAQRGLHVELIETLRRTRGTSNESLERAPESALRRAIRRLSVPDAPRARLLQQLRKSRGDDGRAPAADALVRAVRECDTLRGRARNRPSDVADMPVRGPVTPLSLLPTAGIAATRWQWLGPGNIGGRTRAIVIHPQEPQRMLAASAAGGVWFSANGGARWDPVDDFMANLAVSCLAIDPTNPNLVYAGTGEGFGNIDALRGGGIFRIVGATSWQLIAATKDFGAVNRIAVSRDGKVVLAATPSGLMRSADTSHATWRAALPSGVADVKCHPRLSQRAIAGGLTDGRAWYSTDSGKTWKPATHDGAWSGRVELAYARKNPNVVYASVQGTSGGLWRSADAGKSYRQCTALGSDGKPAPFLGDQGWYGNVVWADDPTDENLLLVGGINLWRSTDGGATLREISTWWDDASVHADHHAIVSHPGYDGVTNRRVFFGNDGGIYKADDLNAVGREAEPPFTHGWTELNNHYGVTQFYGGAVHAGSGRVVGGAQDNGTLALAPGVDSEHWNSWFGGDGGGCAADPSDPKTFYGEYVYLNLHRSTDGATTSDTQGDRYISGQFWDGTRNDWAWKPVPFQIPDARTQDALFIAPFALDAKHPQRLLAGGLSVWETTDAKAPNTPTSGPRWRAIKPSTGQLVTTIAISPADSGVVWVGHEDGAVFRTADGTSGTPAWQRCDHIGPKPLAPRRYCTRIVPHPSDVRCAYATFGGFVSDNVWVTRDSGATWLALGATLPAAPVHALAIHPRRPAWLYAGTEVGLFASADGGTTWSPTNEGPANVSVDELFWAGQTLYCATHGRGMYRIDLSGSR